MTYLERMCWFCAGFVSFANAAYEAAVFAILAHCAESGFTTEQWNLADNKEKAELLGKVLDEMNGRMTKDATMDLVAIVTALGNFGIVTIQEKMFDMHGELTMTKRIEMYYQKYELQFKK